MSALDYFSVTGLSLLITTCYKSLNNYYKSKDLWLYYIYLKIYLIFADYS